MYFLLLTFAPITTSLYFSGRLFKTYTYILLWKSNLKIHGKLSCLVPRILYIACYGPTRGLLLDLGCSFWRKANTFGRIVCPCGLSRLFRCCVGLRLQVKLLDLTLALLAPLAPPWRFKDTVSSFSFLRSQAAPLPCQLPLELEEFLLVVSNYPTCR